MVSGFNHIELTIVGTSTTFNKDSEVAKKLDVFIKNNKPLYALLNSVDGSQSTTAIFSFSNVNIGDGVTAYGYVSAPTFRLSKDFTNGNWTLEVSDT